MPWSRSSCTIRGQSVLCAPLSIDTPNRIHIYSCSAAAAIISGVWRKTGVNPLLCRRRATPWRSLGAAVMAVETGLRHQNADFSVAHSCIVALLDELPQRPVALDVRFQFRVAEEIGAARLKGADYMRIAGVVQKSDSLGAD